MTFLTGGMKCHEFHKYRHKPFSCLHHLWQTILSCLLILVEQQRMECQLDSQPISCKDNREQEFDWSIMRTAVEYYLSENGQYIIIYLEVKVYDAIYVSVILQTGSTTKITNTRNLIGQKWQRPQNKIFQKMDSASFFGCICLFKILRKRESNMFTWIEGTCL